MGEVLSETKFMETVENVVPVIACSEKPRLRLVGVLRWTQHTADHKASVAEYHGAAELIYALPQLHGRPGYAGEEKGAEVFCW